MKIRKIISMFLVLIFLSSAFMAINTDTVKAAEEPTLISRDKTATASSQTSGDGESPAKAVDNDNGSRWTASSGDVWPQWIAVDLDGKSEISKVEIKWYVSGDRAYLYKIEISDDGNTYTEVKDNTNNTTPDTTTDNFETAVYARFVRIFVTGRTTSNGSASIYSLNIYGIYGKMAAAPISLNKTASADSGTDSAQNAVDEDEASKWTADNGYEPPRWLKVDLGTKCELSGVTIKWYNGSPDRSYQYTVDISNDNKNWIVAADKTSNTQQAVTVDSFIITARFVRVTVTGCSESDRPASIWELEVYGIQGQPPELLSESKQVTASSGSNPGNIADGNSGTSWTAAGKDMPQWIRVDLGTKCDVSEIAINWNKANVSYKYTVDISNDDKNWTTVLDNRANEQKGKTEDFIDTTARLVRITITGCSDSNESASINELEIYGAQGTSLTNIAQGKTATASSGSPALAVDGINDNNDNRWTGAANWDSPRWIQVDLGTKCDISEVKIYWYDYNGRAYYYKLEISNDNSNWITVADKTDAVKYESYRGPSSDIFEAAARFVRITVTGSSNSNASASIFEIEIYGVQGAELTNIAKNKPVGASSTQVGNETVKAVNGTSNNNDDRWAANNSYQDEWIKIDLQSICELESIRITWYTSGTRAYYYTIGVCEKDTTFAENGNTGKDPSFTAPYTTVTDKTNNSTPGVVNEFFNNVKARYILIYSPNNSTGSGSVSICEIEIYGVQGKIPTNLAMYKPVATSSIENDTAVPSKAVDGISNDNGGNRWAARATGSPSTAFDNEWIKVDLGDIYELTSIKITWYNNGGGRAYYYTVGVCDDDTEFAGGVGVEGGKLALPQLVPPYRTVIDRTQNTTVGAVSDVFSDDITARYVLIHSPGNSTGSGSTSICEIEIYGIEPTDPGSKKYTATVNMKKDGTAWNGHGKSISLQLANEAPTALLGVDSIVNASVAAGNWKVLADSVDTGKRINIDGANVSANLNYYTVQFSVTNESGASGSTVSAAYNGKAVVSGAVLLGGGELVITAEGKGADDYTYAWTGNGTAGEAIASITIENLSEPVNANCKVTGTGSISYIITVPANIDIAEKDTAAYDFEIEASDVYLYTGDEIAVLARFSGKLSNGTHTMDYVLSFDDEGNQFYTTGDTVAQFTANGTQTRYVSVPDWSTAITAGTYNDIIQFTIEIQPIS